MLNGHFCRYCLFNIGHYNYSYNFLFCILLILCFSEVRSATDYSQYGGCPRGAQTGINTGTTRYSNLTVVVEPNRYEMSTINLDDFIILICGVIPDQCSLLLEWSCGDSPLSGFYNCSKKAVRMLYNEFDCFDVDYNDYYVIGQDILRDGIKVDTVDSLGFSFTSVTYHLPFYNRNLSFCKSKVCVGADGSFIPYGDYYLSDYESDCVCPDFSCCQGSLKRSLNDTISPCITGTTGFECDENYTCTVLTIDMTDRVENCSSSYPYHEFLMVCSGGRCLSLPTSAAQSYLNETSFWILFSVTWLLIVAGIAGWIAMLCKCCLPVRL